MLAGTAVRADSVVPGFKWVTHDAEFEFVNPPADVTVFVVCYKLVNRVPTTSEVYTIRATDYQGPHRWQPTHFCAVPTATLTASGIETPTAEWLNDPSRKDVVWSAPFPYDRFEDASQLNTRHHVVKRFRVEFVGKEIRLTLIDERVERIWGTPHSIAVGCLMSVLAIGSLFVWLRWRPRKLTRPTPQPGE